MKRQPKLEVVIKAIQEAKKITPRGQLVKVYLPNVLKFKQFRLQELKDILTMLENDERILTLMRFPRYLLKLDLDRYTYTTVSASGVEVVDLSKEYFTVKVRRNFNEWSANYWKLTHQQLDKPNGKKSIHHKIWGEFKDFVTTIIAKFMAEKTK